MITIKALKALGIILFTCFSFYYTDKIIAFSKSKDPIMIELREKDKTIYVEPINAIINGDSICSGKVGKKINIDSSYEKMKSYGKYDDSLLVFEEVKPDININDNYDKFVVSGSKQEKTVSINFIVDDETYIKDILKILKYNDVSAYFFIDGAKTSSDTINLISVYSNYFGNLGANSNYSKYDISYTNKIIRDNNKGKRIFCFTENDESILKECSSFKINTVKENIIIDKQYKNTKNNLSNGKIFVYKINKSLSDELSISIKYIKQKGYKIVLLDGLLSV